MSAWTWVVSGLTGRETVETVRWDQALGAFIVEEGNGEAERVEVSKATLESDDVSRGIELHGIGEYRSGWRKVLLDTPATENGALTDQQGL